MNRRQFIFSGVAIGVGAAIAPKLLGKRNHESVEAAMLRAMPERALTEPHLFQVGGQVTFPCYDAEGRFLEKRFAYVVMANPSAPAPRPERFPFAQWDGGFVYRFDAPRFAWQVEPVLRRAKVALLAYAKAYASVAA